MNVVRADAQHKTSTSQDAARLDGTTPVPEQLPDSEGVLAKLLGALVAAFLTYAVLGFYAGEIYFLIPEGVRLIPRWSWAPAILLAALPAAMLYAVARKGLKFKAYQTLNKALASAPYIFFTGFLLFLWSDAITRRFGFFLGTSMRMEVLYIGLAISIFCLCTTSIANSDFLSSRLFSLPVLFFFQALLTLLFIRYADGRMLFSDDHPCFLYRLQLLLEQFPNIPFYDIRWNGGYSAREFFASGILNIFLLCAPFLYFIRDLSSFDQAGYYSYLIPYLFVVVMPGSVYLAGRVFGLSKKVSVLAAIFALGPTMGFFEWLLQYGTIGFAFSAGIGPLTVALAWRLALDDAPPRWRDVGSLFVVSFLCVTWTMSAVVLLPIVILALFSLRRVVARERRKKVICFVLLFLACNGPWLALFIQESNVAGFISQDSLPGSSTKNFDSRHGAADDVASVSADAPDTAFSVLAVAVDLCKRFQQLLFKVNPLLLLFAIPGAVVFSNRRIRWLLVGTVLWLFFVAAVGEEFKPQLELRRMLIPASFFLCCLAAAGLVDFVERLERHVICRKNGVRLWAQSVSALLLLALVSGSILLSPITVAKAYVNRSDSKFIFASNLTRDLSDAVRTYGGNGRTFFLGFILHELESDSVKSQNGGHIAPLSLFSGKPMYASEFTHRKWSSVDPIPKDYRVRGEAGIEEFLDLVTTTAVITHSRPWADYCLSSNRYRQVFQAGRFRLFVRTANSDGYFLQGTGTFHEAKEGFAVTPTTSVVVLKFRYLPKLKTNYPNEVTLSPVPAFTEDLGGDKSQEVFYIRMEVTPEFLASGKTVTVGYHPSGI